MVLWDSWMKGWINDTLITLSGPCWVRRCNTTLWSSAGDWEKRLSPDFLWAAFLPFDHLQYCSIPHSRPAVPSAWKPLHWIAPCSIIRRSGVESLVPKTIQRILLDQTEVHVVQRSLSTAAKQMSLDVLRRGMNKMIATPCCLFSSSDTQWSSSLY